MKKLILVLLMAFSLPLISYGQAIPNGDFENWNIITYNQPDSGWFTSNPQNIFSGGKANVLKVPGYTEYGIHMQTEIVGKDTFESYITNTMGNPTQGQGGVPFAKLVTSVTGYYRDSMVGQDTALLLVIFKKSGKIIFQGLQKFTGVELNYVKFTYKFPTTLSTTPDTMIMAATSSNQLAMKGIASGSWLELDQLAFGTGTGVNYPVPGGSFDGWTTDSIDNPVGWDVEYGSEVVRSPEHFSGNYSVELISTPNPGNGGSQLVIPGIMTTGISTQNSNSGPTGGQPYTLTSDTVIGHYMYIPQGIDTGSVMVQLTNHGNPVGGNSFFFKPASTWTLFKFPISAGSTPDTIRVDASSSSPSAKKAGSALYLDLMYLASAPIHNSGLKNINAADFGVSAYPDPVSDQLHIMLNNMPNTFVLKVYDMEGKTVIESQYPANITGINLPISQLKAGVYFYEISSNGASAHDKFVKN